MYLFLLSSNRHFVTKTVRPTMEAPSFLKKHTAHYHRLSFKSGLADCTFCNKIDGLSFGEIVLKSYSNRISVTIRAQTLFVDTVR